MKNILKNIFGENNNNNKKIYLNVSKSKVNFKDKQMKFGKTN